MLANHSKLNEGVLYVPDLSRKIYQPASVEFQQEILEYHLPEPHSIVRMENMFYPQQSEVWVDDWAW